MKKNVASQNISAQMITATDGSDFTAAVTVTVSKDGVQAAGGGSVSHLGGGEHNYAPTQAETDADFISFNFAGTGAITTGLKVYTAFPQSNDNAVALSSILTDTGTTIPNQIAGLNDVAATDIVSGGAISTSGGSVSNVATVATTTTNSDMRGTNNAATALNLATVDNNVDAILVDTGSTLPSQISALNNLSAVQVNIEMVDVLTVDTYAEPSSVPSSTSSIKDKLSWLFSLNRNKITQTETTQTLRNSAENGSVATCTVSDDGITYIRGKYL